MPEVDQLNAGLAIRGERYRVEIRPRAYRLVHEEFDGTLYISVAARSSSWDDDWARVTGDAGVLERRQDVRLTLTAGGLDELQVLPAKYADLPEFRPGCTLTLEPGMRELILAALQRVECVAQLTAAVCTVIEPLLGPTRELDALTVLQPHEVEAIKAIVLGKKRVDAAIRWSVLLPPQYTTWAFAEAGDQPPYAELGAALRQPAVQAVLAEGGRDLPA
ncbi:hypothetical protein WI40_02280 [Burkholderia ubonensis]|uniref:hypothetical protein n=1 Tax=Burkholderia ubonensis TaxID=101571 RepID=UPI0007575AF9|nr:hypothetical protein [Burkholderia ubonensis]KUZ96510.1 hypothetical protein WI40_02280 [Burkholderia ubonensis]